MGAEKGTSSNFGGGRGSGRKETNRRKSDKASLKTKGAIQKVKEDVKFQQTKHPTEGIVDSYTFKDGKKNQMYGGQVSKATNEYLVSIGEAKRTGGGGYNLTAEGWKMKYGSYTPGGPQTPTAMGTVGAGGIINEIPISEKMFESQKKLGMIVTGAMALTGMPLMGAAFMDYNSKKYSDYRNKFNNTLQSSTSIAAQPTTQTQSNQRITDTKATAETGESSFVETEAERAKRMAAISRRSEALKGKRSFFSGVKQTIAGQL